MLHLKSIRSLKIGVGTRRRYFLAFLWFSLCVILPAVSQEEIQFREHRLEFHVASNNNVTSIIQDKRGWLWIANSGNGLVRLVQGDVVQYLRYLIESFHSYAESKGVNLHFLCEEEALVMDYDPDKMLYIVSNLLSNAIKFTPPGGNVYFTVGATLVVARNRKHP